MPVGILPTSTGVQNTAAWDAAMSALPIGVGEAWVFPPGTYQFVGTLHVRRPMRIEGSHGTSDAPGTIFHWVSGGGDVPAIWIHPNDGLGHGGGSILRHLRIQSSNFGPNTHGFLMNEVAALEHLLIEFAGGDGIHIQADSGAGQNANKWLIRDCTVVNCVGNGLWVHGPDANAGLCEASNFDNNGGAGIWDNSFLGNQYIANQADANLSNGEGGRPTGYRATGATNMSTFLANYCEAPQRIDINDPAMWIGGIFNGELQLIGSGLSIWRSEVRGRALNFMVNTRHDPNFSKSTGARSIGGDQSGLIGNFVFPADVDNLTLNDFFTGLFDETADRISRALGFGLPNTVSGMAPWWLTSPKSVLNPIGRNIPTEAMPVAFPGMHIGYAQIVGYQARAASIPLSGDQYSGHSFERGSISLEPSLSTIDGDYSMYRCTHGGTSGTYAEGRTATSDGVSPIVTLSGASLVLKPGMRILIGGANVGKIVSINGTSMTCELAAAAGAGQAIAFNHPSFVPFAELTGGIQDDSAVPGNATQTVLKGRVAIAAGQQSIVVTNPRILDPSTQMVFAQLQTDDATAKTVIAVCNPAGGNFTLKLNDAATGIVRIGWFLKE